MAKAKLSSFIKRIESKYILAREQYEQTAQAIAKVEKDYKNLDKSLLSTAGTNKAFADYIEKKRGLEKNIKTIREKFLEESREIITDSDKVFNRVFCYTPQDVDEKGLAILEKGNPSENEIIQLGKTYQEQQNATMTFMCAERVKDSENPDTRAWCALVDKDRRERPDHDTLNSFIDFCGKGLRDDAILSDAMHKHHEEFLQSYLKTGDNITVDVINPWE